MECTIIPRILRISDTKHLFDIPDERKKHKGSIPRLAGITFLPILMLTFLPLSAIQSARLENVHIAYTYESVFRLLFVITGALPLLLIGFKDDLIGVKVSHKFVFQILAAILLVCSGTYINNLYGVFGINELSAFIGIPLTILIIVYIINSFNLIDGVDGLAGTLALVESIIIGILLILEKSSYAILAFALCGMLVSFLHYNFSTKQKIFMGDTGALTLGYFLSFFCIFYTMKISPVPQGKHSIIIIWSALFIPLFDTIRVMYIRFRQRKPLFSPDRNHIHHKLIDLGFSHKQVTFIITGYTLLFVVINIILHKFYNNNIIIIINIIAFLLFNGILNNKKNKKRAMIGKENELSDKEN
ncbi:MAG: MraY family glycosyltransferase [Bacteroidaceae bacterium]|nr:undecaprenyl/decaprenyl-phosphate alpha-N-acetylglucosaminyl 1-phosphate transferase [Bacteroidaceae bacterium]